MNRPFITGLTNTFIVLLLVGAFISKPVANTFSVILIALAFIYYVCFFKALFNHLVNWFF